MLVTEWTAASQLTCGTMEHRERTKHERLVALHSAPEPDYRTHRLCPLTVAEWVNSREQTWVNSRKRLSDDRLRDDYVGSR
jgi:hypothetical protein